jgi:hypothetical protein
MVAAARADPVSAPVFPVADPSVAVAGSTAARPSTGAPSHTAPATDTAVLAPAAAHSLADALPAKTSPADETPEDAHLYGAAPAPSPSKSNWIVALGWGLRCSCTVVFQSRDGGATWAAAPGPALDNGTAALISLPPEYPTDSRIFVSGSALRGTPSFVASAFGAPFLPLAVPSGSIALAPTFDRGDDRLFIAGASTVWSYGMSSRVLQPLLTDQPIAQVYAIAAPSSGTPLVFIAAATTGLGTPAGLGSHATVLLACRTAVTACETVSTVPLPMAWDLSLSPRFATDQTVMVRWATGFALSRNGGRNFDLVGVPSSAQASPLAVVTALPGQDIMLWTTVDDGGRRSLIRSGTAGNWATALPGGNDATPGGLTAAGSRIIAIMDQGGIRCSDDGGKTWLQRCPPSLGG